MKKSNCISCYKQLCRFPLFVSTFRRCFPLARSRWIVYFTTYNLTPCRLHISKYMLPASRSHKIKRQIQLPPLTVPETTWKTWMSHPLTFSAHLLFCCIFALSTLTHKPTWTQLETCQISFSLCPQQHCFRLSYYQNIWHFLARFKQTQSMKATHLLKECIVHQSQT